MALCIECPDNTPCAGRIACGDPPNCNNPACNDQNAYPPPLDTAQFFCTQINANARYQIVLVGGGTLRIHAAEPERIIPLEGFHEHPTYHGDTLKLDCGTLIDRIVWTQPTRDSFYALNRFIVLAPTGDPRNASDGAQSAQQPPKRIPKNAGGVMTVGTETLD